MDNNIQTIDVIYYVKRNGVLVPFEDASKLMNFVPDDMIYNVTGYEVKHKVQRMFDELTNRFLSQK